MKARLTLLLIVVPIIAWALFGLLGERVSSRVATRFGAQILAKGDGKFTDAQAFVRGLLKDGTVLMTAACLLLLVQQLVTALARRRLRTPARWIVEAWSAFICLNIFAAIAGSTVLFWCLLFTGKDHTHNYTQYRIKERLMAESGAPSQAVLLGASQTHTQIDPKVLNDRLGAKIWTTELHFPGCSMYDRILCLERLPKNRIDYVVTYVSESDFYGSFDNGRMIYFFGFRDLGNYLTLGPGKPAFDSYMMCGLLGDVFPFYRMWDPLIARARTWQAEDQNQARHDAALESDLTERARRIAKDFHNGVGSDFQKQSFENFARLCRERHCRLIICCGHLNPVLEHALDPALRPDMLAFLHDQAAKDPNIVLLEGSQLPQQSEADYEDLTHVTRDARAHFSPYIADALEKLSREK